MVVKYYSIFWICSRICSIRTLSSDITEPTPGQDYGSFDFAVDNEFAASVLNDVEGDLNQDGAFDDLDRTDFINGWLSENRVNDLLTGDLGTLANGDLNFDGLTDLNDLVRFQQALITAGLPTITGDELVPEPGSGLALIAAGTLLLLQRRRG